ncbi:hypothetical protein [Permianibacter aggregans]|uniref:Uncharacterized protein n=1 Tax=Permianibacter aggregans TaxID=1510150 RepID=A0A4R6URB1_9GAMM|nr:hypothetical protein [Permianibacter aggregans]QGX39426.1 hypothetical protein E2H98_07030 [Permianibacter aggregans]TDQ49838.1 hypothetical protein EV696_103211 [Permianibacter aggregans]
MTSVKCSSLTQRVSLLLIVVLASLPAPVWASSKKLDWMPWLIGIAVTSTLLGWWSAKRTKMFDNIHLRIIGFSVYFWLYAFAQMLVLMIVWSLLR